uniref:RNA-directed DNA polymerase n=1 Tax=Strongyloides venezuelensis TaxID=75913 RepID=A0A0K0FZC3_STRVS
MYYKKIPIAQHTLEEELILIQIKAIVKVYLGEENCKNLNFSDLFIVTQRYHHNEKELPKKVFQYLVDHEYVEQNKKTPLTRITSNSDTSSTFTTETTQLIKFPLTTDIHLPISTLTSTIPLVPKEGITKSINMATNPAVNSTYCFSLAVPIFDHYKSERTISHYVSELETAFMLDNVMEERKKIAILQARTIPHTRILLPTPTNNQTYQAYVDECKLTFPDTLSCQNALNKYLHFNLNFDNFETSIRSFIRIADIALKDTFPAQKEASIRTKLMEMFIHDQDLWSWIRDNDDPFNSLIEDLIIRRQQNLARKKALQRNFGPRRLNSSNSFIINSNTNPNNTLHCTHCQYTNHTAENCHRKRQGHPPGDYTKKNVQIKTEALPNSITTSNVRKINVINDYSHDGLIKRAALLNQSPITVMFDTGANCSVISRKLAQSLELKTNVIPRTIITGGSYTPYYEVEEPLKFNVDGQELSIKDDCYMASTNLSGFDMILGNVHLKKLGAIIDTSDQTVTYKKPILALQFTLIPNNKEKETSLHIKYKEKYPNLEPLDEYDCGSSIGTAPLQDFSFVPNDSANQKWKFYQTQPTADEDYSISQLLQYNIIERSNAFEVLPKYMLIKRDSQGKPKSYFDSNGVERTKLRFVLDARRLNEKTRFMNYAPPTLLNIFAKMTRFDYASKLDLHCGFWQIQLPISDRHHFSFTHRGTTYQFQRLVMGAKNSPMIFQRQMEQIFEDIVKEDTKSRFLIYQDDLLLITQGGEEHHLYMLEKILDTLEKKNCKLNIEKCELLRKELTFLSWKFDGVSASPSPTSVAKYINSKLPKTKGALYATLQAYNYFRTAISDYTTRTHDLYKLSYGNKKDIIKWTPDLTQKFQNITNYIIQEPKIYLPLQESVFYLHTDASQHGLGGCLSQKDINEQVYPIGFISIPLKPTKKHRSATYLELLAIKKTLELFSPLLVGSTLQIYTDHRPLTHLISTSISPRFIDLIESIMSYNVNIQYLNGPNNQTADWLSRLHTINHMDLRKRVPKVNFENTNTRSLKEWQDMDISLQEAPIDKEGQPIFKRKEDIVVTNDVDEKPVIPNVDELHKHILKEIHDKNGHFCTTKILKQINKHFYWPKARTILNSYIQQCIPCQRTNITPEKFLTPPESDSSEWKEKLQEWEVLAADCCGPLSMTTQGNKHYIVFIDIYTKYIYTAALPNLESNTINLHIDKLIAAFGRFKILRTDGARYFISDTFKNHLQTYNTDLSVATAGNSRGNCYAERAIRTISAIITKLQITLPDKEWDELLPLAVQSYNQSPGPEGIPQERLFKRVCYSPLFDILKIPNQQRERMHEFQNVINKQFEENKPRTVYVKEKRLSKFQPAYSEPATLIGSDNTTGIIKKATKRISTRKLRHLKGWKS